MKRVLRAVYPERSERAQDDRAAELSCIDEENETVILSSSEGSAWAFRNKDKCRSFVPKESGLRMTANGLRMTALARFFLFRSMTFLGKRGCGGL